MENTETKTGLKLKHTGQDNAIALIEKSTVVCVLVVIQNGRKTAAKLATTDRFVKNFEAMKGMITKKNARKQ